MSEPTIPPPRADDYEAIILDVVYLAWNDGTRGWDDDILGIIRRCHAAETQLAELLAERQRVRADALEEAAKLASDEHMRLYNLAKKAQTVAESTPLREQACIARDVAAAIRAMKG